MIQKRKFGFAEQALEVMSVDTGSILDPNLALLFLFVQSAAEQVVVKAALSPCAPTVTCIQASLPARSECIRIWTELTVDEAIGFAIQISVDGGRNWTSPLDLLS